MIRMKNVLVIVSGYLFCLCACRKTTVASVQTPFTVQDSTIKKKSYLALGDSYTIGQGVQYAERFPLQTVELLRSSGVHMDEPLIIAQTGWTTTALSNAILSQNPKGPFSVVSLLIGVNDQYQKRDTTGYRQRFQSLLSTSVTLAGGKNDHVFVLSIPDYSVTPFARNSDTGTIRIQIEWFNEICRQVTFQNGCNWLNITPYTKLAATDKSLLASDSLHPSGKEYGIWARDLAPLMLPKLR
jgi:lysophospholipase L1-like esterase